MFSISEPNTYDEAICNKHWSDVIQYELTALMQTCTWNLVTSPQHKKYIACRWVFKLKLHVDGSVERYKARLVAKGFTQTEGLDYMDTFISIVKMTTIRMFMAIAIAQYWPLFQLDVNTAILHGDLLEEVYMQPPPGLSLPYPNMVFKLQKSLYGLKQASRQWNSKLPKILLQSGYTQSKSDYSSYTESNGLQFTVILVYVGNLF